MRSDQTSEPKAPLTVILPVLNEERNLPDALESVEWADQIIVVDSYSTDRTKQIARTYSAEVVDFDYRAGGPKKKTWALGTLAVKNGWILLLDADERITLPLRREIEEKLRAGDADGYYIDRDLLFMGQSMRCFRPNWNLRLFRRNLARVEDLGLADVPGTGDNEIHEHVVVDGKTSFLENPLRHDDYRGLTAWLERHNKYATWEAHLYQRFRQEPIGVGPVALLRTNPFERKRVLRRVWVRLPLRPMLRFVIWYVFRRGFADGRAGLTFCILMSYYEFIIGVKMRELERASKQATAEFLI